MSSRGIAKFSYKELPQFVRIKNILELQLNIQPKFDKTMTLHGIQIRARTSMTPEEKTYDESILILLSFENGSVQTLMFQKNVNYNSFINIEFEKPFHIKKNTMYSIEMRYLSEGYYFMGNIEGDECPLFELLDGDTSKYNPITGILYSKTF